MLAGKTVFITPSSTAPAETPKEEESKGPNKVGIAVGVVVGVLVLAAAGGAFYFWHRKTRRNELEEEYKRQAAIAAFVAPSTETSSYDTRLDTAALRRMSDGSIADNQDYSRRILKVCCFRPTTESLALLTEPPGDKRLSSFMEHVPRRR